MIEKNRPNFGVAAKTVAKSIKTQIEGPKQQHQTAFQCLKSSATLF
jgi:hypothetical protein